MGNLMLALALALALALFNIIIMTPITRKVVRKTDKIDLTFAGNRVYFNMQGNKPLTRGKHD